MIYVNLRTLDGSKVTGIKRYADEIIKRLPQLEIVHVPASMQVGWRGRLWEQAVLPRKIDGLLWSPANIGPIMYRNQIVTIHDVSPIDHPEWFSPNYSQMTKLILPPLAKNVKKIITVSEYSKSRIVERCGVSPDKISVISLGIDSRFQTIDYEQRVLFREKNKLPDRYILTVCSLDPRKNLGGLFKAWQSWHDKPKDLKLLIIGAKDKVFSSVGFDFVPEDVVLMGYIEDSELPYFYACAEAFAYPSLYEGFGLPPLEAMACGTPVITSNTTSLPEVVGDCAIKIDPLNIDDIREAMSMVVENRDFSNELVKKGLKRVEKFNWDDTALKTWETLSNEDGAR